MAEHWQPRQIDEAATLAEHARALVAGAAVGASSPSVIPFPLREFDHRAAGESETCADASPGAQLDLRIELGRAQMRREDLDRLRTGSVVPLDRLADDPVDVFVGGRLFARGQVVVVDHKYCVRVIELIAAVQVA
jgi:flagellar motor switch protein FliN/FliY